jgi:CBS domain-containing protein
MTATLTKATPLTLRANTAEELMTANPVSVCEDASVREALALLTDRGISAAPVIDDAGRPVGVLSQTDLLVHDRETVEYLAPEPEFYCRDELRAPAGERLPRGFQVERVDRTRVRDVMTPAVFSVPPDTPAARVVGQMLALNVHRLFVVDGDGVLVGVVSTTDVLRHLRPWVDSSRSS